MTGAILVALQHWTLGGDRRVHRRRLRHVRRHPGAGHRAGQPRSGAFLDSVFDRAGEVDRLPRHRARAPPSTSTPRVPVLAAAAMGAAFMVSYIRAQVRGPRLHARAPAWRPSGSMPREVRLVLLSIGLDPRRFAASIKALEFDASRLIAVGATLTASSGSSMSVSQSTSRPRVNRREQEHAVSKNGRTARTARRRAATPGQEPDAAATARSASRSSASATARAASSRAATTTRTRTTTTSSRA